ncbi:serine hydrolase domain-containing protein [Planctomonas sp. JC2975]|uniref:serine hydrolase n=1 Tax=Planctomonas sp. JC2975 TaxID=2729626 RepID=UPI00197C4C0E
MPTSSGQPTETRASAFWRTSTAEAEGVDPAGIRALIDAYDADPAIDPHALIVVRHGAVVASAQWAPYATTRPQLVYSLSKSFTSTAAGFAAAEGLLDLDTSAVDYFPEYADSVAPESRRILVRHLASMATGHLQDMIVSFWQDREHPIRQFFATPPEREPGTVFTYNQLATYTLGVIVQRRSGQRLTDYLQTRLFEPLGIPPLGWQQQPADVELGFSGLFAPPEAIAKLGRLYLDGGVWDGERLLPEWWVKEATSLQVANATPGDPLAPESDWAQGYGFQFWMSRHGFRGDGAFGQFCLVLPEQDAVVAITAQVHDMQQELNLVWEHLLPAFHDEPLAPRPDGGEALLGLELSIPFPADLRPFAQLDASAAGEYRSVGDPDAPDGYPQLTRVVLQRDADGWTVALHEDPAGSASADGSQRPTTSAVPLDDAVDDPDRASAQGWIAAVAVPQTPSTPTGSVGGRVGDGSWAVTEGGDSGTLEVPIAARGGILDADSVATPRIDVAFIDTPHRLTLTFDTQASTVTAQWTSRSLGFAGAYQLRAVRPGESFVVER